MAKTGNKATRKMAKKGLLDFTSRGLYVVIVGDICGCDWGCA
jgi:hypothetical protein